jgi:L-malate glycosyltransferase
MKPLNIFLISNMYPSASNSTYGVFVSKIERQLVQLGANISSKVVITKKHQHPFKKALEYLAFYLRILHKGIFKKYEIIYAHYPSHSAIPILIIKFIKPSVKIVVNFHGSDVTQIKNSTVVYLTKNLLKKVNLVISPSEYFIDFISKKYSVNKKIIYSSPSGGVNCKKLFPMNKKNDVFTIGYLSRIDPKKGWDILIHSLSDLKSNGFTNFKCIIGGDGSEKDKLTQLIHQYELNSEINYVGKVNPENINDFYNSLDAFIFPTQLNESLGLVGAEAMACGIPVIASNSGGQLSYIMNDKNGFVYNADSSKELSEKILHFYHLPIEKIEQFKINARETALTLDSEVISNKLYKKIESIL